MLENYLKTALRNILRNKLYAFINITGLTMGLTLYIFGGLFYDYEHSHDAFFKNSDRIYTVGSKYLSQNGDGESVFNSLYPAATPLIKTELGEIEQIARTITRSYLMASGENTYYQTVRFADFSILEIFDFNYIAGDKAAFNNGSSLVMTKSMADKFFPGDDPIGKIISINHEIDLIVGAVIEDLPANTHFNSNITINRPLELIVPISLVEQLEGRSADENWGEMSTGNLTYILLPETLDQSWLDRQLNGIYERHYDEDRKRTVSGLFSQNITYVNASVWDEIGIPAIDIVRILGIVILFVACLNYTNLATAQSLRRSREVGLRKTLGASPTQLLIQFITESTLVTAIAMIVSLAVLEMIIPSFNNITGKVLSLNYLVILPWLLLTVIMVGFASGLYPAYLITKTNPSEALRDNTRKGKFSALIRGIMIAAQFSVSVFMLAFVMVVLSQNNKVEEDSNIFSNDKIFTIDRVGIAEIEGRHETLKREILNIDGVEYFAYSSQVPYEGFRNRFVTSTDIANIDAGFFINQMVADHDFLNTYEIPLVAGRQTSQDIALDTHVRERRAVNAMVNELAVRNMGFENAESAIGQSFYENDRGGVTTYTIVGVIEDQNIYGLENEIVPFVYFARPDSYRHASVKLNSNATEQTIQDIESVWKRINPEYPFQARFLDHRFEERFRIFDISAKSLASFTIFAMFLALIGLFGLAAFMAEQRTREIGIRKVLGANPAQIVKLLIWQFSKPVLWAIPFALLFAFYISGLYLEYFPDRISMPFEILIGAGIIGLILSWITVASHAYKVARTNPVKALHYE